YCARNGPDSNCIRRVAHTSAASFIRFGLAQGGRIKRDLEKFSNTHQRRRPMDGAFLDSDNGPSVPPKGSGYASISTFVRFDFVAPEGSVRSRKILAGTTVPETAIHKKRYFSRRPSEIGLSYDGPMSAVAFEAGRPEQFRER